MKQSLLLSLLVVSACGKNEAIHSSGILAGSAPAAATGPTGTPEQGVAVDPKVDTDAGLRAAILGDWVDGYSDDVVLWRFADDGTLVVATQKVDAENHPDGPPSKVTLKFVVEQGVLGLIEDAEGTSSKQTSTPYASSAYMVIDPLLPSQEGLVGTWQSTLALTETSKDGDTSLSIQTTVVLGKDGKATVTQTSQPKNDTDYTLEATYTQPKNVSAGLDVLELTASSGNKASYYVIDGKALAPVQSLLLRAPSQKKR